MAILYELARNMHDIPNIGYCLELGTFCGTSAAVMATALKKSNTKYIPLFTVDLYRPLKCGSKVRHREIIKNAFNIARKSFYDLDLQDYVCQIAYDDLAFLQFWDIPIRLAFIDASHDYGSVRGQIDAVMKNVVLGGWVVFHDYLECEWSGVILALNEFIDSQPPNAIEVFADEATVAIQKTGEIRGTSSKLSAKRNEVL